MEFYYLLADEVKTKKPEIWRKNMPENDLFPAPMSLNSVSNEEVQKSYELFRLVGTMIAKSIVDDRLIDLPISSLFWDLLLGKVIYFILNIFIIENESI